MILASVLVLLVTQLVLIYLVWAIHKNPLAKFSADVATDIRCTLRHLTDLTADSLKVRGGYFQEFSPYELITQRAKAESPGPTGGDEDGFEQEAAGELLDVMHCANRDTAQRSEPAYWTRERVHTHALEYRPGGSKWKEHQSRRDSHPHGNHAVGE